MLLPIRTNIRPWRTPYVNYGLIIVNAVIFLVTYSPHINPLTGQAEILRRGMEHFMLVPLRPALWQYISYAFLHGGIGHIVGNMFFLYLFGNNVNDKLGHIGYLCFYLAGGVFSGVGHTLLSGMPVLGASGAVAAVTGAYLVLFPQTLITVVYWFIFIGTMEVPALYFIAFKLIFWDNVLERNMPNVAYGAHLSGYAFGILAVLGLLASRLISTSDLDLWSMLKQWNRRRRYRDAVTGDFDPFSAAATAKKIKVKEIKETPAQKKQNEKIQQLRQDIANWIARRNLSDAAKVYLELMEVDSSQILPHQQLLDIANQLASINKPRESAEAYEQFLAHYNSYEYSEQVELMLGILYSRYLDKPGPAKKYLSAAAEKLSDSGQLKMCRDELARLQS